MGLFKIKCSNCNNDFMWFSGNTNNQLCELCSKKVQDENLKSLEEKHISSLMKIIELQDTLIEQLKEEISRLKLSVQINPSPNPNSPGQPFQQSINISPFIFTPNPLVPPWIVTSGDTIVKSGECHNNPMDVGSSTTFTSSEMVKE